MQRLTRWLDSLIPAHLVDERAKWRARFLVHGVALGMVIAGSSAGAMVMCEYYFDPKKQRVERGLNLVPNACVLPHHNNFGKTWAKQLMQLLPKSILIGVDERTGVVSDPDGGWQVYGAREVTLYWAGADVRYGRGERFSFL